jgi:membrane protease YdiL (CAAX protease family)
MTGNALNIGVLEFVLALSWCTIAFASYYFLSNSPAPVERAGTLFKGLESQGRQVMLQRLFGVVFLGIFSSLIILLLPGVSLRDFGFQFSFLMGPPWWACLLVGLSLLTAGTPWNLAMYPQIRSKLWTPRLLFISAIGWLGFLIAYEFMFRGFLLHASLNIMQPVPAIAVNVAIYAFAHMYKGPGETFGAIPLGIVLCYLTIITGNIWSAVILHSVMALSNEWFSIRAHPDMNFSKSG